MNGYIADILNKYANIGIDENLYKLEELINYKLEKFYFDEGTSEIFKRYFINKRENYLYKR